MNRREPGSGGRETDGSPGALSDSLLLVGVARRAHGVAGEVSVEIVTDFPERFAPGLSVLWKRGSEERALEISSVRPHGGRLLIRFAGVGDTDAARALAGGDLWVPERDAVAPPEGFFYSHEVEGWRCVDRDGRELGVAAGVESTPGGPMLFVDAGRAEPVSVPFVRPIVVDVDREGRRIVLDPPEGLMDL